MAKMERTTKATVSCFCASEFASGTKRLARSREKPSCSNETMVIRHATRRNGLLLPQVFVEESLISPDETESVRMATFASLFSHRYSRNAILATLFLPRYSRYNALLAFDDSPINGWTMRPLSGPAINTIAICDLEMPRCSKYGLAKAISVDHTHCPPSVPSASRGRGGCCVVMEYLIAQAGAPYGGAMLPAFAPTF